MIDHFGIIVKDIEASKAFYEAVLTPLGYAKTIDESYGVGFSNPDRTQHTGIFWLGQGEPSSPLHFAFAAPSRAAVDAFYAAGLAAGAQWRTRRAGNLSSRLLWCLPHRPKRA